PLMVLREARPRRIDRGEAGRCHPGGIARGYVELLPLRRYWRGGDALGECLVVDEGNIESADASLPAGREAVFTARLRREDIRLTQWMKESFTDVEPRMLMGMFEFLAVLLMFLVAVRV